MDLMNPSDLLIRFRQMLPFQQTVVAGLILFVVYELYASLVAGLKPLEAARESMYNTIIFMVVFYFATVVIMRKNMQAGSQVKGPKKGFKGQVGHSGCTIFLRFLGPAAGPKYKSSSFLFAPDGRHES